MSITETANQRAKVAEAIDAFLAIANANCPENYSYTAEPSGKKYRIVMEGYGSHSVHAFVDGDTGDLLKAAGWKVPAKGVRYNLLTDMEVIRANFGWAGGYLYADYKRKPVPTCPECGATNPADVTKWPCDDGANQWHGVVHPVPQDVIDGLGTALTNLNKEQS